jgi:hypothetical protein
MNIVMASRIVELSEKKKKLDRLKQKVRNWKGIALVSILFLTVKVACEQLMMAMR